MKLLISYSEYKFCKSLDDRLGIIAVEKAKAEERSSFIVFN